MPICRYFIQGRCEKGAQCEFDHPGEAAAAATQRRGAPRGRGRGRGARGGGPQNVPTQQIHGSDNYQDDGNSLGREKGPSHRQNYQEKAQQPQTTAVTNINPEDVIRHDLVDIKVEWPLSCYGLNLNWESGDNIIHGDFSPEELRCEAYSQSRTLGNIDSYQTTLLQVKQEKQRQMDEIVQNPARGVALGRTPRAVRTQHIASSAQILATPQTRTHSTATISAPSSQPIHRHPSSQSRSADSEAFNFGSIPELPPS